MLSKRSKLYLQLLCCVPCKLESPYGNPRPALGTVKLFIVQLGADGQPERLTEQQVDELSQDADTLGASNWTRWMTKHPQECRQVWNALNFSQNVLQGLFFFFASSPLPDNVNWNICVLGMQAAIADVADSMQHKVPTLAGSMMGRETRKSVVQVYFATLGSEGTLKWAKEVWKYLGREPRKIRSVRKQNTSAQTGRPPVPVRDAFRAFVLWLKYEAGAGPFTCPIINQVKFQGNATQHVENPCNAMAARPDLMSMPHLRAGCRLAELVSSVHKEQAPQAAAGAASG